MDTAVKKPKTDAANVNILGGVSLLDALDASGGIPLLGNDGKIQNKNLPSDVMAAEEVTITDTTVSLAMQANKVYRCTNPVSALTITSIPDSIGECYIIFTPNYESAAQQDLLCPITMPQGVDLINFTEEEYKYNKQAIIAVKFGMAVFGQSH